MPAASSCPGGRAGEAGTSWGICPGRKRGPSCFSKNDGCQRSALRAMAAMSALEFHPLAELFPLVEGPEFDELVSRHKASGRADLVGAKKAPGPGQDLLGRAKKTRSHTAPYTML